MVVFFATNSDMRRFLTMLETLWQSKNNVSSLFKPPIIFYVNILYGSFQDSPFPISNLTDADPIGKHCSDLFVDINRSWDPLISAALGYAQ